VFRTEHTLKKSRPEGMPGEIGGLVSAGGGGCGGRGCCGGGESRGLMVVAPAIAEEDEMGIGVGAEETGVGGGRCCCCCGGGGGGGGG